MIECVNVARRAAEGLWPNGTASYSVLKISWRAGVFFAGERCTGAGLACRDLGRQVGDPAEESLLLYEHVLKSYL